MAYINSLTKEQRIKRVEEMKIIHPGFHRALSLIEESHQVSKFAKDPQCLLIIGPPGAGKTRILETYKEKYDRIEYGMTGRKRVLLAKEIPSPTKINRVTEELLADLGDPNPVRGKDGNKLFRLTRYIKDNEIELIMLDEFHHFVNKENQRVNYEVSEWFKSLINMTKVPIVVFGLEHSTMVLEANEQLERRIPNVFSLNHFEYQTSSAKNAFYKLMSTIDEMLPFDQSSNLSDFEMCDRFFYATKGIMDKVMKLVRLGARIAIEQEHEFIHKEDFARACNEYTYIRAPLKVNPFQSEEFKIGF